MFGTKKLLPTSTSVRVGLGASEIPHHTAIPAFLRETLDGHSIAMATELAPVQSDWLVSIRLCPAATVIPVQLSTFVSDGRLVFVSRGFKLEDFALCGIISLTIFRTASFCVASFSIAGFVF